MWVSYSLWSEFVPQTGLEEYHCHKKRGLFRARSKNPQIAFLKKLDIIPQRIGKLSQKAIYYLYHHPECFTASGIDLVGSNILKLGKENNEVRERVNKILQKYLEFPFLEGKKVIELNSGESKKFTSTKIDINGIYYKLYTLFDCVIQEDQETIHIIDFKTSNRSNSYDLRQAFVYLLASQYIYPTYKVFASFYNLELAEQSERYFATEEELEFVKHRLSKIAIAHKQELKAYRENPRLFNQLFPASPGKGCQHCPCSSVCEDYVEYFRSN